MKQLPSCFADRLDNNGFTIVARNDPVEEPEPDQEPAPIEEPIDPDAPRPAEDPQEQPVENTPAAILQLGGRKEVAQIDSTS